MTSPVVYVVGIMAVILVAETVAEACSGFKCPLATRCPARTWSALSQLLCLLACLQQVSLLSVAGTPHVSRTLLGIIVNSTAAILAVHAQAVPEVK